MKLTAFLSGDMILDQAILQYERALIGLMLRFLFVLLQQQQQMLEKKILLIN